MSIESYYKSKEEGYCSEINMEIFMSVQKEVDLDMRAKLIDWMVYVHLRLSLSQQSLFLAVQLLDRVLAKQEIAKTFLQLLGITVLFVACKYQEVHTYDINQFLAATNQLYTHAQLLSMEFLVLNTLSFQIEKYATLYIYHQLFAQNAYHLIIHHEQPTNSLPHSNQANNNFIQMHNQSNHNLSNQKAFMLSRYLIELSLLDLRIQ